jgi:hypothetical protein
MMSRMGRMTKRNRAKYRHRARATALQRLAKAPVLVNGLALHVADAGARGASLVPLAMTRSGDGRRCTEGDRAA